MITSKSRIQSMDVPTSSRITWNSHELWLLNSPNSNGCNVLYVPTLATAMQISAGAASKFRSGVVVKDIEERLEKKLQKPSVPKTLTNRAFHMGIGLTLNCSLRCRYCHASAGEEKTISRELLFQAIDLAFARAKHSNGHTLSVSFAVGGEPTYVWSLFKDTVVELRKREHQGNEGVDKVFLSMTTNGYYGEEKRRFIASHFDHITLSLDGTPEIQNLHRPSRYGRSTYSKVAASLHHFLDARPRLRIGVRATVSTQSVHALPVIVEKCAAEFGGGYALAFEPLLQLGNATQCTDFGTPSMRDFFAGYVAARRIGLSLGIRVTTSGPSLNRLVAQYCGAMALPSFAVCVDGAVTACHRDCSGHDYGYGRLVGNSGQFAEDPDRLREIAALSRVPQECEDCYIKWNCAGDCPDLRKIGWKRCDLNKALIYSDLIDLISHRREN
jgi:uncharacterized protein